MGALSDLLRAYAYDLPQDLIALTPAHPRDSARLLVYSRSNHSTRTSTFASLADFIPPGALLVFNDTRVIPARIYAQKETGGMMELLLTDVSFPTNRATAIGNAKLEVGDTLTAHGRTIRVEETTPNYRIATDDLRALIEESGRIPIPPYLKKTPMTEAELRREYQTIFAKVDGSIAAPTASLHFTPELMKRLEESGIETCEVTLHVNLGTFAPLTEEAVASGQLHEEFYEVSGETAARINAAKNSGRPVITVGTTVCRTLESAGISGSIVPGRAATRLFIREGFRFRIVDGLITNFHVPESSLLMLVAALIGRERLFELYELAKRERFRFFSFGDGMLLP
jgi:S-adenosylmethionine:tRNA ribosyltransferase-isomerase